MTSLDWASDGGDAAVADTVAAAIRGGARTLALPGGATPRPIFAALAARPLPWAEVTILPGDERLVADDHPARNAGQLRAAFGATGATVRDLVEGMAVPPLDLVWLGMGTDGHVASIFPGGDYRWRDPAAVIRVRPEPLPPEAPFARLTLNLAALVSATAIILVIRGSAKRALLEDAARQGNDLPIARLLAAARTPVTVYWSPA